MHCYYTLDRWKLNKISNQSLFNLDQRTVYVFLSLNELNRTGDARDEGAICSAYGCLHGKLAGRSRSRDALRDRQSDIITGSDWASSVFAQVVAFGKDGDGAELQDDFISSTFGDWSLEGTFGGDGDFASDSDWRRSQIDLRCGKDCCCWQVCAVANVSSQECVGKD